LVRDWFIPAKTSLLLKKASTDTAVMVSNLLHNITIPAYQQQAPVSITVNSGKSQAAVVKLANGRKAQNNFIIHEQN
jgi:hypothetical protein